MEVASPQSEAVTTCGPASTPGRIVIPAVPLSTGSVVTSAPRKPGDSCGRTAWDDLFAEQAVAYPPRMSFERISIDPDRMQGLPCIRGTRVTVSAVLGQLAAGRSIDDVIEDYPQLERADVLGALEYAAAATRDREIPLTAAG